MSEWTEEREAEVRARCEMATDGPWRVGQPRFFCQLDHGTPTHPGAGNGCVYTFDGWMEEDYWKSRIHRDVGYTEESTIEDGEMVCGTWNYEEGGVAQPQDAQFIAHARADLPDALDEIARLRDEIDTLQGGHRIDVEVER